MAFSRRYIVSDGSAPYSFGITDGSLPPGLIIDTSGGEVYGTPSAQGTYNFTVVVTDALAESGQLNSSIVISAAVPPTAGNVSATVAASSQANPITLSLGGGATSVSLASAASHGTALASGTSITYTPTAGYSGQDSFTYIASKGGVHSAPATVSITVSPPTLAFSPSTLSGGLVGTDFTANVTASGGNAPYTYTITAGLLPVGLSLNTSTGQISGRLTTSGSFNVTLTAIDANNAISSRSYSVTVTQPVAQTVPLPGSASSAAVLVTSSQSGCTVQPGTVEIRNTNLPSAPPSGTFPRGVVFFSTNAGCAGARIQVKIDYPAGSLAGMTMKKYGPNGNAPRSVGWFTPADLTVTGDSVTYSVVDDGDGDNETGTPGVITDPFAPVLLTPAANAQAIPTLGEWTMGLLSLMAAALGASTLRRRPSAGTRPRA